MINGRNHQKTGYQKFLDDLPGGILICLDDDQFTIVEANEGFYGLFGYTRRELEEQFSNRYIQMIHPDDRVKIRNEVHRAKTAGYFSLNYRGICKDGEIKWILANCKFIEEKDTRKFICIMVDVTAANEEREQLRLSLEQHKIFDSQTTDIIFEWD